MDRRDWLLWQAAAYLPGALQGSSWALKKCREYYGLAEVWR